LPIKETKLSLSAQLETICQIQLLKTGTV